jgi:non-homologous end joining protein Ku
MAAARSGRAYAQPGRSSFSKTIMFEGDAPMLGMLTAEVKGMPLFESSTRIKGKMIDPDGNPVEQFYRTAGDGSWEGKTGDCGRAFEYSGHVLTLTDSELDAIKGNDDNIIRIRAFTDEFDPAFVERTHVLWWSEDKDVQQYDILLALLKSRPTHAFVGTTVDHGSTKAVVIRYST